MSRTAPSIVALGAALALVPASSALAATPARKPTVTTGLPGGITPLAATLTGTVDPNRASTTYAFRYGTSTKYTVTTPTASAGKGRQVAATAAIGGLKPNTRYHYRLVAHNTKGTTRGEDRTFRTPRQPLGFTIAASPTLVPPRHATTIVGTLGGTGGAGHQVILQQSPWPYTGGYRDLGNAQITSSTGTYAFPLLGLPISTRFRVITPGKDPVVSPEVAVVADTDISSRVHHHSVTRRARLQFSGAVHPARVSAVVRIQRRVRGRKTETWDTVASTRTVKSTSAHSRYKVRATMRRGGDYRALLDYTDGSFNPSTSSTIRIHTHR